MKGALAIVCVTILLVNSAHADSTSANDKPLPTFDETEYDNCTYSLVRLHCSLAAAKDKDGRDPCLPPPISSVLISYDSLRAEYGRMQKQYAEYRTVVEILEKSMPTIHNSVQTKPFAQNLSLILNAIQLYADSVNFTVESLGQDLDFLSQLLPHARKLPPKLVSQAHMIARDTYDYLNFQMPNSTAKFSRTLYYFAKKAGFGLISKYITAHLLDQDVSFVEKLQRDIQNVQEEEVQIMTPSTLTGQFDYLTPVAFTPAPPIDFASVKDEL